MASFKAKFPVLQELFAKNHRGGPCGARDNRGQGHLRSPGKKRSSKKFRDLEVRYMFIGQIFAKNAKNDPKTLLEASKSVKKIKLGKSRWSPEMTWKVSVFDMFYVISQPFLKLSTWNFVHIFISHCPLTYCTFFFFKILMLRGKILKKKKTCWKFWKFLVIFKKFKIRDSSFVALLILRHFI